MVAPVRARSTTKKRKVVATSKKIHELMHQTPDPCTYQSSEQFVSGSLVGVEIELENMNGFNVDSRTFHSFWRETEDGSLRGGGKEYVLSRPFAGKDLEKALNLFDKHVAKSGHRISVSERTSVHVHIDVRELTHQQVTRLVCIYAIFEDALFNLVGKDRANNIFATSLANAEGNLKVLGAYGENPDEAEARHTMMHFTKYSACNISAVKKYGSLEFRNHEGTYDIKRIIKWINILLLLKEAAINMEISVEEVFGNISANGAHAFFNDVFKEYSADLDYPNLEFDMFNGLRLAQDIIYSQRLESGVKVPESKDSKESYFAKYYKKRKPKRFKERFTNFLEAVDVGGLSFTDYGGGMRGIRGGDDIQNGAARLRRAVEGITIDINREYNSLNFELEGE